MEKLTMMKEKAKDTKSSLENLDIKGKIQAVQNDFTLGWRSIADKARKEAKTLNKKARKALATYEEGSSVRYDQIYDCDFDTGFDVWLKFQMQWIEIRENNAMNTKKAEVVDTEIDDIVKAWRKWEASASAFHDNLVSLPDVIAKVEIAQSQITAVSDQIVKVDALLVEFEDICARFEMEKEKCKERLELSQLIEKRQIQFQALKEKYEMTDEESKQMARVLERQESIEKQQVYEDAFIEQMDRYIRYGELDKPIAGSVDHDHDVEDVSFDDADLDALKEFLGPEELNNVLMSKASLAASVEKVTANDDKDQSSGIEESINSQKCHENHSSEQSSEMEIGILSKRPELNVEHTIEKSDESVTIDASRCEENAKMNETKSINAVEAD